ncbi:hypothetical protein PCASD_20544 [Puccinia coronata f. sp. avenae]|uniref:Uncharacterized protein n=1 Tax=Puccinia coronata f. sp. avenae TaxID=200324 RepID=A0A2N5T138_9BASI|nr:hypothetical protein PCASD_20544 [Puccinia coronata f. sp. avenae]
MAKSGLRTCADLWRPATRGPQTYRRVAGRATRQSHGRHCLPAGPASAIRPGWQVAIGCLPPPWACRRLSSPRGTTPSGHRLLPGPVGDCPAHPGPHRQATGGHTIMPPRPIPPIQGGDSPDRSLPHLVWHLSPC